MNFSMILRKSNIDIIIINYDNYYKLLLINNKGKTTKSCAKVLAISGKYISVIKIIIIIQNNSNSLCCKYSNRVISPTIFGKLMNFFYNSDRTHTRGRVFFEWQISAINTITV